MSEDLLAALARPSFYPGAPANVEMHETYISWVFLAGRRAYKLKKPLVLPFLDYGTAQRRRQMCKEEVRLNRRLAPNLYLGVRAIAATPQGLQLAQEDDPRALDYLVEMRRFDERRTLAARLRRGELSAAETSALAGVLARFHERAPQVSAEGASSLALQRRIAESFDQLLAVVQQRAELRQALALQRFSHAFVFAHAAMLDARASHRCTREVHGDLRAEHVLLGAKLQILDCVEFDQRLRELDVAEDLAFLVMDLAAHGASGLADKLVAAYRDAGGDPGEDRLVAFYALQRALVRMKVELTQASQHPPDSAAHGHHSAAARELLSLAGRLSFRARLPLAIAVCGLPAAGKSELAAALARASGLAHLSSDLTRKRLAGIDPAEHGRQAIYSDRFDRLTYTELGRRAARQASAHGGVLIDASFRRRADRDAFRQAFGAAAPLLYLECRAPVGVLAKRAARRDQRPGGASDATLQVVLAQSASWEPLDEVDPDAHLALRSDRPLHALIADTIALLDERLGYRPSHGEAAQGAAYPGGGHAVSRDAEGAASGQHVHQRA